MAYYGLSHPLIAKLDVETGTYSKGFQCGKAVGTDITPNYNEATQYGDDEVAEYVKEFKDADVNLSVTELPLEAANTIFGHTVDNSTKNIIYNASDSANFVGYGFYVKEMVKGVVSIIAAFLPKIKLTETAESYATKGDSIEFKNPSLSGKASSNDAGKWKEKQTFETEEAAITWLKTKLGMTTESVSTQSTTPEE